MSLNVILVYPRDIKNKKYETLVIIKITNNNKYPMWRSMFTSLKYYLF